MGMVRIPASIDSELTGLAESTGRSKSYYVVAAVQRYLEAMQERFDAENKNGIWRYRYQDWRILCEIKEIDRKNMHLTELQEK